MKTGEILKKLVVFSPAVVPFSGIPIFGIDGINLTVSRAYILFLLFVYLIHSIRRSSLSLPKSRGGTIFLGLFLYGVLLLFSVFWSDDMVRALTYSTYYFWYLIFIGIILVVGLGEVDISRFYAVWVLTGVLVGLLCFIEITFEVRFSGSRYISENVTLQHFRPTATMHNENNLAIYLAITSVMSLAVLQSVNNLIKGGIFVTLLWFFYVILLTGSRGAFVVLIAGTLLFFIFSSRASLDALLKNSVAFLIGVIIVSNIGLVEIVEDTYNQVLGIVERGDARIPLLQNALGAMQENNYLGVGAGGIERYMTQFNNVDVENVHNWLGEILANTGILGGLIWTLLFYLMLMFSISNKILKSSYWTCTVVIFLLFPLWQSIVSSMIQFMVFWLFLAVFLVQIDNRNVEPINT